MDRYHAVITWLLRVCASVHGVRRSREVTSAGACAGKAAGSSGREPDPGLRAGGPAGGRPGTAGGGAAGPGAGDGGPARVRAARPGGERGAGSHYAHYAQTFADWALTSLIPERKELNEKGNVDQSDQDSVS
jgi:hypothetical protein